jgi:hypothetical protein
MLAGLAKAKGAKVGLLMTWAKYNGSQPSFPNSSSTQVKCVCHVKELLCFWESWMLATASQAFHHAAAADAFAGHQLQRSLSQALAP